jgi:hypothetical protein
MAKAHAAQGRGDVGPFPPPILSFSYWLCFPRRALICLNVCPQHDGSRSILALSLARPCLSLSLSFPYRAGNHAPATPLNRRLPPMTGRSMSFPLHQLLYKMEEGARLTLEGSARIKKPLKHPLQSHSPFIQFAEEGKDYPAIPLWRSSHTLKQLTWIYTHRASQFLPSALAPASSNKN